MDQCNYRPGFSPIDYDVCQPATERDGTGEKQQPPLFASRRAKSYDYTLKFLLVGDSDVGKEEILSGLSEEDDDADTEMDAVFAAASPAVNYKSTLILLDGKKIRLQLW